MIVDSLKSACIVLKKNPLLDSTSTHPKFSDQQLTTPLSVPTITLYNQTHSGRTVRLPSATLAYLVKHIKWRVENVPLIGKYYGGHVYRNRLENLCTPLIKATVRQLPHGCLFSHVMQTFQDLSFRFYIKITVTFHHLLIMIIVSMGVDPAFLKSTHMRLFHIFPLVYALHKK